MNALSITKSFNDPESVDSKKFNWTKEIICDQVVFQLVTKEKSYCFNDICTLYQINDNVLFDQLQTTVIWCVYNNSDNKPIGAVMLEQYELLKDLKNQVTYEPLADKLFSKGISYELSYALDEKYRGAGIGSRIVKAFIDHAISNGWNKHIFAVVSLDNQPSLRILEKNGFSCIGTFVHNETRESHSVYIS